MGAAEKIEKRSVVQLVPGRWVLENIITQIFGFTRDQLQKYRAGGLMLDGVHFTKNPAGRIVYNVEAINNWQEGIM